ncbi:calcium-binding protein [Phyllobacterium zundukense]|uniref:Calcium-binding protein n=1 Tax=Phyllobacterium zundukense TaxID=1867719 RepID=A0A2N9VRY7_9HYPH|nr:hypothetical protein B5P45_24830 [Phyllobacterium zundukense]
MGSPVTNWVGWITHALGLLSNAPRRIFESVFHNDMKRDSVIILSNLSNLTRASTWVYDKQSSTSDHYGDPAFILGTDYDDRLKDGTSDDKLEGRAGNDWFWLSTGNDVVAGGAGADKVTLEGYFTDYTIEKTGDHEITLTNAIYGKKVLRDVEALNFMGDMGNDLYAFDGGGQFLLFDGGGEIQGYGNRALLVGGDGIDKLNGASGNDIIYGGNDTDIIKGQWGDDTIYGQDGADALWGDDGNDWINGGDGDDSITGGRGNDRLTGGAGSDRFKFMESFLFFGTNGIDTITDFGRDDILQFTNQLYGADVSNLLNYVKDTRNGALICGISSSVTLTGWTAADFKALVLSNPSIIEFV